MRFGSLRMIVMCLLVLSVGCENLPGKPRPADRPINPIDVTDFTVLWTNQCSGCHGADGRLAAARPLHDPLYLAVVSDAEMREVISFGTPGTAMPGFLSNDGLGLTGKQIDLLLEGMRARWSSKKPLSREGLLAYRATGAGDPKAGAATFARRCGGCHGANGRGGTVRGSVVDPSYLALVSDQALRSVVLFGRTDLGMPHWQAYPDGPLRETEVVDLVAWLGSHRVEFPGSPYAGNRNNAVLLTGEK